MNAAGKKEKGWVIGAALLALCAGAAWKIHRRVQEADAQLAAALLRQKTEARAAADQAERLAAAESDHAKLGAALVSRKVPKVKRSQPTSSRITIAERLQKDPKFQLAYLATMRAESAQSYAAFIRQRSLSADKAARLEDLLARSAEDRMDLGAVREEKGLTWADPTMMAASAKIEQDLVDAEKELLGPEDYGQLAQYNRTLPARDLVDRYAGGAVTAVGQPFTLDQGNQLITAIADSSPTYRQGNAVEVQGVDWSQVEAQARTFLTPRQMEILTSMEPPLPSGGRFQTQFYGKAQTAIEKDQAAGALPVPAPSGG